MDNRTRAGDPRAFFIAQLDRDVNTPSILGPRCCLARRDLREF